jgi:DNA-binding transcriptional LysR family regulator
MLRPMSSTLPLFDEFGSPAVTTTDRGDRHLRAARRLSRAIRRLPDGSAEQTRTGLAICAHLRALLAESNLAESNLAESNDVCVREPSPDGDVWSSN